MTVSVKLDKLPGTFNLLKRTIQLYFSHWDIFLGYAGWLFLPFILSLAAFLAFKQETANLIHAGISQSFLMLLVAWLNILIIQLIPLLKKNVAIPFHRIGKDAILLLIPFLITSIVVQFLTITGLLLLIIPGIYLGTIFFFAPIITVRNGLHLIDALKKSRQLTRERFFATFGRLINGAIILSLLALLVFVGVELARVFLAGGGLQNIFLSPPSLVTEILYQAILIFFLPAFMIYQMLLFIALEESAEFR